MEKSFKRAIGASPAFALTALKAFGCRSRFGWKLKRLVQYHRFMKGFWSKSLSTGLDNFKGQSHIIRELLLCFLLGIRKQCRSRRHQPTQPSIPSVKHSANRQFPQRVSGWQAAYPKCKAVPSASPRVPGRHRKNNNFPLSLLQSCQHVMPAPSQGLAEVNMNLWPRSDPARARSGSFDSLFWCSVVGKQPLFVCWCHEYKTQSYRITTQWVWDVLGSFWVMTLKCNLGWFLGFSRPSVSHVSSDFTSQPQTNTASVKPEGNSQGLWILKLVCSSYWWIHLSSGTQDFSFLMPAVSALKSSSEKNIKCCPPHHMFWW